MSAFVIFPTHIDVILSVALNGPSDYGRTDSIGWSPTYLDELIDDSTGPASKALCSGAGRALLEECIRSVWYRYPDTECAEELPGPIPIPVPSDYEFTDLGRCATTVEACKAIACFEYQSCEHPGWSGSGARRFCERLRAGLTGGLPRYEDAPWEWSPEILAERGLIPAGLGDVGPKETRDGR